MTQHTGRTGRNRDNARPVPGHNGRDSMERPVPPGLSAWLAHPLGNTPSNARTEHPCAREGAPEQCLPLLTYEGRDPLSRGCMVRRASSLESTPLAMQRRSCPPPSSRHISRAHFYSIDSRARIVRQCPARIPPHLPHPRVGSALHPIRHSLPLRMQRAPTRGMASVETLTTREGVEGRFGGDETSSPRDALIPGTPQNPAELGKLGLTDPEVSGPDSRRRGHDA